MHPLGRDRVLTFLRTLSHHAVAHAKHLKRQVRIALITLAVAVFYLGPIPANNATAGPPYEFLLAGAVNGILRTIILGEFTETRRPSHTPKPEMPDCRPADFERLKAAAGSMEAIRTILEYCKLVESKIGRRQIESTVFLPKGYCETIKEVFEAILLTFRSVNRTPPTAVNGLSFSESKLRGHLEFTYKNVHQYVSFHKLLASLDIRSTCASDGSLHVVTPRNR